MSQAKETFDSLIKKIEDLKISKKSKEDIIDNIIQLVSCFQNQMLNKQTDFEKRITEIEKYIKEENDFMDDEYSIKCPYCNNNIYIVMKKEKFDMRCPICNNVIQVEYDNSSNNNN